MRNLLLFWSLLTLILTSCDKDPVNGDNPKEIKNPETYVFERNGKSTVDFNGQTTRIKMATELVSALSDPKNDVDKLLKMFAHTKGENNFTSEDLNQSDKSVRSKTAASKDYFSGNATDASIIKNQFDDWIKAQANDVFPQWEADATAGNAGKIQAAGGGSTRHVSAQGVEYNQLIAKGLIGALMLDQILNNYLSTAVLDEGQNKDNNSKDIVETDKSYTTMEHKWDEAYGYLYGAESNAANPTLGADRFLNNYLKRVEDDEDYKGIASRVFNAFKLGRAAIVAHQYKERDKQIKIIQDELSKVPAIRAIYYLANGKKDLEANNMAGAFHALSEGIGFLYSLQFTRNTDTDKPYFTKSEVDKYFDTLLKDNGFWDVSPTTLETIAKDIADRFKLNYDEASK